MNILIEEKSGNVTVYNTKKLTQKRNTALKSVRKLYQDNNIKHDALQDHIFIGIKILT